jgi:hypothetical protein
VTHRLSEEQNKVTARNKEVGNADTRKARNTGWNIYRGYRRKELPSNFYIIKRQEDVMQKDQEEDGLIFEDGTG